MTRKIRHDRRDSLPPNTPMIVQGYKEPLAPVKDGFGHYGVVAYDKTKQYVQCHLCGYLFRELGMHLYNFHKFKTIDYKKRFGLKTGKSLVAPNARRKHFIRWETLTAREKTKHIAMMLSSRRNKAKNGTLKSKSLKSLEEKNLEGRCPEQLLDKILALQKVLGKTPTRREFKKYYKGYLGSVEDTFGSWGEALRILGLAQRIPTKPPIYTRDMALAMLRNFEEQYGRKPYWKDTLDGNLPSIKVYYRIFGSWAKAKKLARVN